MEFGGPTSVALPPSGSHPFFWEEEVMMRRAIHSVLPAMAALCAIAVVGCPGGGTAIQTDYVEGVVTLDGEPVAGAIVTFQPKGPGGMSATGMTDEQGKYTLNPVGGGQMAAEAGSGTLAGEYYVGVVKTEMEVPLSEEEAEEQGVEYVPPTGMESTKVTHIVPERYNNPKESGIEKTVTEGQNSIPIELTSP
jgi:hypothetical protein